MGVRQEIMILHSKAVRSVRKQWEGALEQFWKEWLGKLLQRQDCVLKEANQVKHEKAPCRGLGTSSWVWSVHKDFCVSEHTNVSRTEAGEGYRK